eukprot:11383252-Alexandrium_andersonii.AAC.1
MAMPVAHQQSQPFLQRFRQTFLQRFSQNFLERQQAFSLRGQRVSSRGRGSWAGRVEKSQLVNRRRHRLWSQGRPIRTSWT